MSDERKMAIDPAHEALMDDYDARRCCVCDCRHPSFGFGPPMTREIVWACGAHRGEVEARLRGRHPPG